jgi:Flp pilus assembly protein TadB
MASRANSTTSPASQRRSSYVPVLTLVALAVAGLLITGTILTLGLLVVPTIVILALAYALWRSRRARQADSARSTSEPRDAASAAAERTQ